MTPSKRGGEHVDDNRTRSVQESIKQHLEEATKVAADKAAADEVKMRKQQVMLSIHRVAYYPDPRWGRGARIDWRLNYPKRPEDVTHHSFFRYWVEDRWFPSVRSVAQEPDILTRIKSFVPSDHLHRAVRELFLSLFGVGAAMNLESIVEVLVDIHETLEKRTSMAQGYFQVLHTELTRQDQERADGFVSTEPEATPSDHAEKGRRRVSQAWDDLSAEAQANEIKKLSPRIRTAFLQYGGALARMSAPSPTDRGVHEWLCENWEAIGLDHPGPEESFTRALRRARELLGAQKNQRRHGRSGKNVVQQEDI